MKAWRRYLGVVFIALLLTFAFINGAHACTPDDEDPADYGWQILCSNTET